MRLEEFAPAKVNLYLHVTGRRPDGYHLLDSLAVFPAIGDVLRAAPAEALTLRVQGPFAGGLQAEPDNLVLRAAQALAGQAEVPARAGLVLEKNLPVASGIGGGSADAAASLRLLARMWNLPAASPALAAGLGADVPVCLAAAPSRMGGVGEVLSDAPALPEFGMVLANPRVPVSTPQVFRARAAIFTPPASLPAAWPDAASMAAGLSELTNDLQDAAVALCPPIAEVLAALRTLPGCLLARMSGSGATCFALFATPEAAQAAALRLKGPEWWVWGGAGQCGAATPPEMGLAQTGRST